MEPVGPRRAARLIFLTLVAGCNALLPGAPSQDQILEGPVEGLTGQQLAAFVAGDEEFARRFGVADGLGPIFVAASCEACHVGDGKGHPLFNLRRFGRMGSNGVFDPMRHEGGPQIQNRAILQYVAEVVPQGVTGASLFTAPSVTGPWTDTSTSRPTCASVCRCCGSSTRIMATSEPPPTARPADRAR